ncbi:PepSY domain-containing protein [Luteithermobacter gelatinilyticus]|uniref:PepSY domain-containing protein n=1 Tax=Luteithermobacter gelatinilyticus TaxID=2582913 RepID=UPI001106C531|nr:PepSY domain-containing protein [Luteithermobacter gelatinilyticus]
MPKHLMLNLCRTGAIFSLLVAGMLPVQGRAEDDPQYRSHHLSPEQLQKLRQDGSILSLEEIIRLIRRNDTDRLLEVELLEKDNILFYKVELLEQSGIVRKYFLDPRTGTPFSLED